MGNTSSKSPLLQEIMQKFAEALLLAEGMQMDYCSTLFQL